MATYDGRIVAIERDIPRWPSNRIMRVRLNDGKDALIVFPTEQVYLDQIEALITGLRAFCDTVTTQTQDEASE